MKIAKLMTVATTAFALIIVSCSSSDSDSLASSTTFSVDGAWARTSPMASTVGAAYMQITPSADDALVGAAVDSSVAMVAQVHETTVAADGSMGMQEIAAVEMIADTPLSLEPGGYHIMLIDLVKPLEVGTSISITLSFESGASIVVEAPVLIDAP